MREIEFRGLRTDGKGWVYGYYFEQSLAYGSYSTIYSPGNRAEEIDSETIHVIRETVGQFTGIHDENGDKIFEGDILDSRFGNVVCTYEPGSFVFRQPHGSLVDSEFTIIGNIHEHPHLIK